MGDRIPPRFTPPPPGDSPYTSSSSAPSSQPTQSTSGSSSLGSDHGDDGLPDTGESLSQPQSQSPPVVPPPFAAQRQVSGATDAALADSLPSTLSTEVDPSPPSSQQEEVGHVGGEGSQPFTQPDSQDEQAAAPQRGQPTLAQVGRHAHVYQPFQPPPAPGNEEKDSKG